MPRVAPELLTLLIAERLAFERLQRLKGYPDDVVRAAEELWRGAGGAVQEYRAPHPQGAPSPLRFVRIRTATRPSLLTCQNRQTIHVKWQRMILRFSACW